MVFIDCKKGTVWCLLIVRKVQCGVYLLVLVECFTVKTLMLLNGTRPHREQSTCLILVISHPTLGEFLSAQLSASLSYSHDASIHLAQTRLVVP